jgi:hypothetical protein
VLLRGTLVDVARREGAVPVIVELVNERAGDGVLGIAPVEIVVVAILVDVIDLGGEITAKLVGETDNPRLTSRVSIWGSATYSVKL